MSARRFTACFTMTVLLCLPVAASAHELILKPAKMSEAKGETLPVEIHSTHIFIAEEELEDVSRVKGGAFRGGKAETAVLTANESGLRIDMSVKIEDDGAILLFAEKDGEPWAVTSGGGRAGTRSELEAQGLKVLRVTKNDKYARAIVNAAKNDKNFATALGQELEIVPVTNPADVKAGEYLQVQILLRGQPTSLPVRATWDGFEAKHQNTWAFYTESDADGMAWIRITQPGLWIVHTLKEGLEGVEGEYDSRNLRSALTVEIR